MTHLQSSETNFTLLFFSLVYLIKEFHISVCVTVQHSLYSSGFPCVISEGGSQLCEGHPNNQQAWTQISLSWTRSACSVYIWVQTLLSSRFRHKAWQTAAFPSIFGRRKHKENQPVAFRSNGSPGHGPNFVLDHHGNRRELLFLHHTQTNALVTRRNVLQQGSGSVITKTPTWAWKRQIFDKNAGF